MKQFLALSRPAPAGEARLRRSTVGHRPNSLAYTRAAENSVDEITRYGNKMLFPLHLPIRYELLGGRPGSASGSGRGSTIRVGSHSLAFLSDRVLELNRRIRFKLDWPVPPGTISTSNRGRSPIGEALGYRTRIPA